MSAETGKCESDWRSSQNADGPHMTPTAIGAAANGRMNNAS